MVTLVYLVSKIQYIKTAPKFVLKSFFKICNLQVVFALYYWLLYCPAIIFICCNKYQWNNPDRKREDKKFTLSLKWVKFVNCRNGRTPNREKLHSVDSTNVSKMLKERQFTVFHVLAIPVLLLYKIYCTTTVQYFKNYISMSNFFFFWFIDKIVPIFFNHMERVYYSTRM